MMAPTQVGIEDFEDVFQDQVRTLVCQGVLDLIAREVEGLCSPSQFPNAGMFRRGGTEKVTIRTVAGKERIAKRRVRAMQPNGLEREVVLNTVRELRRRKGLFDEVLDGMAPRHVRLRRRRADGDE